MTCWHRRPTSSWWTSSQSSRRQDQHGTLHLEGRNVSSASLRIRQADGSTCPMRPVWPRRAQVHWLVQKGPKIFSWLSDHRVEPPNLRPVGVPFATRHRHGRPTSGPPQVRPAESGRKSPGQCPAGIAAPADSTKPASRSLIMALTLCRSITPIAVAGRYVVGEVAQSFCGTGFRGCASCPVSTYASTPTSGTLFGTTDRGDHDRDYRD